MYNLVKSEGIGDIVTPYPSSKYYVLVIKPSFSCNTKLMYEKLDSEKSLKQEYYTNDVLDILNKNDIPALKNKLYNVFEYAIDEKETLQNIKHDLINTGAISSLLSGSGSCIFGIYDSKETLNNSYNKLKNKYNYEIYRCVSCK